MRPPVTNLAVEVIYMTRPMRQSAVVAMLFLLLSWHPHLQASIFQLKETQLVPLPKDTWVSSAATAGGRWACVLHQGDKCQVLTDGKPGPQFD
jgi:hypothetical protein